MGGQALKHGLLVYRDTQVEDIYMVTAQFFCVGVSRISGPNIGPKQEGSLYRETTKQDPQFMETTI